VSELLIVRHGQATVGTGHYDKLSERGWEQSRRLGVWLAAHHPEGFAHVVVGGMRRHRETLEAIGEAYTRAGRDLAAATTERALDEFDHQAVLLAYRRLGIGGPAPFEGVDPRADPRAVYRLLRSALLAWSEGALESDLSEGWTAFSERVAHGAERLRELARDSTPTLVVTSGGVIAQLARRALGLTPAATVTLNLALRNSALSEFRSFDEALGLQSWNTLPHLASSQDRELWTYY
jgi:broad specificity phosphatase PhoE